MKVRTLLPAFGPHQSVLHRHAYLLGLLLTLVVLGLPNVSIAQEEDFVTAPTKGSCDPRNCHEFANCLVDGGFGDISISPKLVEVGEQITISFTGEASPPVWPSVVSHTQVIGWRGGNFVRWQDETYCGNNNTKPTLVRDGNCSGATTCKYTVTDAGSTEATLDGKRPWSIVRLEFQTGLGLAWDEDYFGVIPEKKEPTASFTWEPSETDTLTIDFDASASFDSDGEIVKYEWDFGNDETEEGMQISYTFPEARKYNVTLTVTDDDDEQGEDEQEVKVGKREMSYTLIAEPDELIVGEDVTLKLAVENTGELPLTNIAPVGEVQIEAGEEGGAAELSEGPNPANIASLEPGVSDTLKWVYTTTESGMLTFSVEDVKGKDPDDDDVTADDGCSAGKLGNSEAECPAEVTVKGPELIVNSVRGVPRGQNSEGEDLEGCNTGETIERDGETEVECTLRAAIQAIEAGDSAGKQADRTTIRFDIPDGTEHTIGVAEPLVINTSLVIDGTTQPGYNPETGKPVIELSSAGSQTGLTIQAEQVIVRGLAITRFPEVGIHVKNWSALIEKSALILGNKVGVKVESGINSKIRDNIISGNTESGVLADGGAGLLIENNRIGTNNEGTAGIGNKVGVRLTKNANTTEVKDNLVSGNTEAGILVDVAATSISIQGNKIGTNLNASAAVPNGIGIKVLGHSIRVGTESANVISGNSTYEVLIQKDEASIAPSGFNNQIHSNAIGTTPDGSEVLGKGTLRVENALQNKIGGSGGGQGNFVLTVEIDGGKDNRVEGNFIGSQSDGETVISGTLTGPGYGILLQDTENTQVTGNHIASQQGAGLILQNAKENHIEGNDIFINRAQGIMLSGEETHTNKLLENNLVFNGDGIALTGEGVRDNEIEGNTIASNRMNGITLPDAGQGNAIRQNEIFSNGVMGIDLGGNGVDDYEPNWSLGGPNRWLRYPALHEVSTENGVVSVRGHIVTLVAAVSATYSFDFFSSERCGNSFRERQNYGEGEHYLRSMEAPGEHLLDFDTIINGIPDDHSFVTATVTDAENNTSEFSRCMRIVPSHQVAQTDVGEGETGTVLDENGVIVTVTSAATAAKTGSSGGTLYVTRYEDTPAYNFFSEATATAHDGSSTQPTAVANRYWMLGGLSLIPPDSTGQSSSFTFDLCLDLTDLVSDDAAEELVLVQRNEQTKGVWEPFDTQLEEHHNTRYACASGFTQFGDFSLGLANAAPVLLYPEDGTEELPPDLTLQWEAMLSAVSYDVQLAYDPSFTQTILDTTEVSETQLALSKLDRSQSHFWRVRAVDAGSVAGPWSATYRFSTFATGVDVEEVELPEGFMLSQNYPNPFNPETRIRFELPQAAQVRLVVYDALGRRITILADGRLPAGRHEAVFEAHDLPSGLYLYQLQTPHQTLTRKMLLLK